MNKILSTFLIFTTLMCTSLQAFSYPMLNDDVLPEHVREMDSKKVTYMPVLLKDDTAPVLKPNDKKVEYIPVFISDDTAPTYTLHAQKVAYIPIIFKDDTAPIVSSNEKKLKYVTPFYKDLDIVLTEDDKYFKKPVYTGEIDLTDGIPVYITPIKTVKTHFVYKTVNECFVMFEYPTLGTNLKFKVIKDVIKDGKVVLKKGSIVTGIIGNVVTPGISGVEGEITIERLHYFDSANNYIPLQGNIYHKGVNMSFVRIIGAGLAPLTFGLSELAAIMTFGTNAIIKQGKIYTVYYK